MLLRKVKLFGALPEQLIKHLSSNAKEFAFASMVIVRAQQSESTDLLVVTKGALAAVAYNNTNTPVALNLFAEGDLVGVERLLGVRRAVDILSLTSGEGYAIRGDAARWAMDRYPEFRAMLAAQLARLLTQIEQQASILAHPSAPKRIARTLLSLAQPNGKLPNWVTVQAIAMLSGTARETASRTLNQLARSNIISLSPRPITILNPAQLKRLT